MRLFHPSSWGRHSNGIQHIRPPGWQPPLLQPQHRRQRYLRHLVLFLVTCVTTIMAGMLWEGIDPIQHPELFSRGLPYAGTLLAILLCHEMGHYLTARYYGMDVTLPFFIPAPPLPLLPLGTFGAFIRMQSPPQNRRALLYVGAAGPIAGFCVALPAMIYAYATSTTSQPPPGEIGLYFGEPLLLQLISHLVLGTLPDGTVLHLGSVGMAAWFGILVTMLNLLPMGQLDGGHIVYTILGPQARYISWLAIGILLALGFLWQGWFIWAVIGWLTSRRHPFIIDQQAPLNRQSQVIAGIALVIFIVCFMPVPIALGDFPG